MQGRTFSQSLQLWWVNSFSADQPRNPAGTLRRLAGSTHCDTALAIWCPWHPLSADIPWAGCTSSVCCFLVLMEQFCFQKLKQIKKCKCWPVALYCAPQSLQKALQRFVPVEVRRCGPPALSALVSCPICPSCRPNCNSILNAISWAVVCRNRICWHNCVMSLSYDRNVTTSVPA